MWRTSRISDPERRSHVDHCKACGRMLEPDDMVVVAARQLEVSNQEEERTFVDGVRSFFHEQHWNERDRGWAARDRGPLRQFRPGTG
jgi:hypothetical protein